MLTHSATQRKVLANMGALDILTRKKGVIVGEDVLKVSCALPKSWYNPIADPLNIKLFKYAQEKKFAIPAIVSFFIILLIWIMPGNMFF
jgi:hypothetical protein